MRSLNSAKLKSMSKSDLEERCAKLEAIAIDLAWLARRYCDGRQTYAPSIYNEHARALLEMGVQLNATGDGLIWAKDGDGIDGLSEECHTPGHPEAVGHVIPLPPGTHLVRELEYLLGKDTTAAVVRMRALMEFAKNMLTIDAMGNVELEFAYKRIGEMARAVLASATEVGK